MKNWKDYSVGPTTSILKTIEIIDQGAIQTVVVVDEQGKL